MRKKRFDDLCYVYYFFLEQRSKKILFVVTRGVEKSLKAQSLVP